MAQARSARAITYSTDREDEVSKIFIIKGSGTISIHEGRLQISEAGGEAG